MIRAGHRPFYVWFFNLYSKWMIRYHFRRVVLTGEVTTTDMPVMLIGNHFSWWDGFIACYLNRRLFRKKFHVMMLEEQLRPRMFLSRAGAYSIRKNSRSIIESINYTVELLQDKNNLVVMYPQGEFSSIYTSRISFEKGISTVAGRLEGRFRMFFYAALIDYFAYRKPTLYLYVKEFSPEEALTASLLESAYHSFYTECIEQQKPG
jgi:1-acyl-sn-glycerol-3-phosphate acyltransferase